MHNSVKYAGIVMVLVLCISSDHALYLYMYMYCFMKISKRVSEVLSGHDFQ